jgi:hypothetical protein
LYEETLKDYWSDRRKHVENLYKNLPMPYPNNVVKKEMDIIKEFKIEDFVKYISSWSAIEDYYKKNKNTRLLEEFKEE